MFELTKRLLGLDGGNDPPEFAVDPVEAGPAPDPKMLGLYDAMLSGWFQNATGELFTGMPISAEDVVLDAGCGEGNVLAFCARLGAHVIAVDMHEATLEVARKLLMQTSARQVDIHCARADRLPVGDAVASRVICTEVLEHVDDPGEVLRELYRVGRTGALYLFSAPETLHESLLKEVAPASYFQSPNHVRVFSREAFANLIVAGGLEILSHDMVGFYWSIWWALYWGCRPDLSHPHHPVLDHWTMAWQALIGSEQGQQLKRQLDQFMPKSQVILARKPSTATTVITRNP